MQLSQKMMRMSFVAIAVILSVMITGTNGQNLFVQCCKSVSTQEITIPISGFRFQKKDPPCVRAVIFFTSEGEKCSHWSEKWVREKIQGFVRDNGMEMNSTASMSPKTNSTLSTLLKMNSTVSTPRSTNSS